MNVTSALPQSAPPSAPPAGDAVPAEAPAGGSTFADLLARQPPETPLPAGDRASPKARFDQAATTEVTQDKPKTEDVVAEAPDATAIIAASPAPAAPAAPAAPIVAAAHPPHIAKEAAGEPVTSTLEAAEHAKPADAASPVATAAIAAAVAAQSAVATPEPRAAQSDATSPAIDVVAATPAAERARTTHGIPAQVADAAATDAAASASQAANANPAQPTHQLGGAQPSHTPPAQQAAQQPAADASAITQPARNDAPVAARPAHFVSDVAVEVVRQAAAGRQEFTIRLDPPDLGRVDVSLEFHRGEVRAVVSTDNPATHDLLRRDADGFARVLTDNGFRTDGGALRFDLRDGSQQRGFVAADGHDGFGQSAAANDTISTPQPVRRRGILDLVA